MSEIFYTSPSFVFLEQCLTSLQATSIDWFFFFFNHKFCGVLDQKYWDNFEFFLKLKIQLIFFNWKIHQIFNITKLGKKEKKKTPTPTPLFTTIHNATNSKRDN